MNEPMDHYHQKLQREKRNDRLLGIVTIIVLAMVATLLVMEVVE